MGSYGFIWVHMGSYGFIWVHMGSYGLDRYVYERGVREKYVCFLIRKHTYMRNHDGEVLHAEVLHAEVLYAERD
jgi:hypothetical protein